MLVKKKPLSKPPEDPNKGQNRVPSDFELATLRSIHARNSNIASTLEREMNVAKDVHDQIHARYKRTLQDLKAIKSELNASHRSYTLLENQHTDLQVEINKLKALMHPIRRCPDDVLMLLFEWAVDTSDEDQLQTAVRISQVCQTWRSVAFQTSTIWSQITVSMATDALLVWAMFNFVSSHLRSTPPDIVIQDIVVGPGAIATQFMSGCSLVRFPSIRSLTLQLASSNHAPCLLHRAFRYSTGSLAKLLITSFETVEMESAWDYATVLDNFPTAQSLEIHGIPRITAGGEKLYPNMKKVNIDGAIVGDILWELSGFSEVEEVHLNEVTLEGDQLNNIEFTHLRSLSIFKCPGFPLQNLTAPQLNAFDSDFPTTDEIDFIYRHSSLRNVHIAPTAEQFRRIAQALPDLEDLSIELYMDGLLHWKKAGLRSMPFPMLRRLVIHIPEEKEITRPEFETLLKSRRTLSAKSASRDQEMSRLQILEIVGDRNQLEDAVWRTSSLLDGSSQVLEDDGESEDTVTLKITW